MLQSKFSEINIILGSQSPRRQDLLAKLDLSFEIVNLEVDENYDVSLQKEEITEFLCKKKKSAHKDLVQNQILITSDTIVWCDNKAFGKPKDKFDAMHMLQRLSGRTHQVITSVGIFSIEKEVVFSDITDVTFSKLSFPEIEYYIKEYQPFDKAGAYGIQEWIGVIGINEIKGSYYNVMGLPLHRLYEELERF